MYGSKAKHPDLPLTALLETSEGNYSGVLKLAEPIDVTIEESCRHVEACINANADAGYCDPGSMWQQPHYTYL